LKTFKSFLEGRGISDEIKEYSDFITSLFENKNDKFQLDLDYGNFPLIDLRIEYILTDRYHSVCDPSFSSIKKNKLHDILITIEIDKNNVDLIKIKGILSHELTHIKEFFEIQKNIEKTGVDIKPHYIKIRNIYSNLKIDKDKSYYKFIYLLYLSLDTEMNARISQVYHYLYELNINDEDDLFEKLKEHQNWKYMEMLNNFNVDNFIEDNISEINLEGLIKITNDLVKKFKQFNLNKHSKLLSFIKDVSNLDDVKSLYDDFASYFNKKSEKHIKKFRFIVKEVIEDLNGNRPFNEDYRNKIKD